MNALSYFAQFLTAAQVNATCAFYGYLLELAVKAWAGKRLAISSAGRVDLSAVIDGKLRRLEVKQNGGDFRHSGKGSSYIAYAIYIDPSKPLTAQLGYVMPMSVFRETGTALNFIRDEKADSKGNSKMALQTLWNYSKDDFHGRKAEKLMDAWEAAGAIPFKEFFK